MILAPVHVPKPPVILMPRRVDGGREEFWLELGKANYFDAYIRHNRDQSGSLLPDHLFTGLPDGSTWLDHVWDLTPGTKIYDHPDILTVLTVAETPAAVIIWTQEHPEAPLVYGEGAGALL